MKSIYNNHGMNLKEYYSNLKENRENSKNADQKNIKQRTEQDINQASSLFNADLELAIAYCHAHNSKN